MDEHSGDYHKNFNGENFARWWKTQLLPNLTQPSLIIMDNAAYHRAPPSDHPNITRLKKHEVVAELRRRNIPFDEHDFVLHLKLILRQELAKIPPYVVSLAREAGHTVLFTPPYHSDLQPIELLWAHIKGKIGRLYTLDTSFKDVYNRLVAQFKEFENDDGQHRDDGKTRVQAILDSIDAHLKELEDELEVKDSEEDSNGDADCSRVVSDRASQSKDDSEPPSSELSDI